MFSRIFAITITINEIICFVYNTSLSSPSYLNNKAKEISKLLVDNDTTGVLSLVNVPFEKLIFESVGISISNNMLPDIISKRAEYLQNIKQNTLSSSSDVLTKIEEGNLDLSTVDFQNLEKESSTLLLKRNKILDKNINEMINEIDKGVVEGINLDDFYNDIMSSLMLEDEYKTVEDLGNFNEMIKTIKDFEDYLTLNDGFPIESTMKMYTSSISLNPEYREVYSKLDDKGKELFAKSIVRKQITVRKFLQENKKVIEEYTGKTIPDIYKESLLDIQNNFSTYTKKTLDYEKLEKIQDSYKDFLTKVGEVNGFKNFGKTISNPIFPSIGNIYSSNISTDFFKTLVSSSITDPGSLNVIKNDETIDDKIAKKLDQFAVDYSDLYKNIVDAPKVKSITDLKQFTDVGYKIGYNLFKRFTSATEPYEDVSVREKYFGLVVDDYITKDKNHPVKDYTVGNLIYLCSEYVYEDTEGLSSSCLLEDEILISSSDFTEESEEVLNSLYGTYCIGNTNPEYETPKLLDVDVKNGDFEDVKTNVNISFAMTGIVLIIILLRIFGFYKEVRKIKGGKGLEETLDTLENVASFGFGSEITDIKKIKAAITRKGCDSCQKVLGKEYCNIEENLIKYKDECIPNPEKLRARKIRSQFSKIKLKIKNKLPYQDNPEIMNYFLNSRKFNLSQIEEGIVVLQQFYDDNIKLVEEDSSKKVSSISKPGIDAEEKLRDMLRGLGDMSISSLNIVRFNLWIDLLQTMFVIFYNVKNNDNNNVYGRESNKQIIQNFYETDLENFNITLQNISNVIDLFNSINPDDFNNINKDILIQVLNFIDFKGEIDENVYPSNLLKPFSYNNNFLLADFSSENWVVKSVDMFGEKSLITDILTLSPRTYSPKTKKPDLKIEISQVDTDNIQSIGISYKKDSAWTIQSHFSKNTWELLFNKDSNNLSNFLQYCADDITEKVNESVDSNKDVSIGSKDNYNVVSFGTIEKKGDIGSANFRSKRLLFGFGSHLTAVKEKNMYDVDTIWCQKYDYMLDHLRIYMDPETHIIFQSSPFRWNQQELINTWDDFWSKTKVKKYQKESKNSPRYPDSAFGYQVLSWRNDLSINCNIVEQIKNKLWFKILINNMQSERLSMTNFDEKYMIWYDFEERTTQGWKLILSLEDMLQNTKGIWKSYTLFEDGNNPVNGTKLIKYYKEKSNGELLFPYEDLKNIKYTLKKYKSKKLLNSIDVKLIESKLKEHWKYLQDINDINITSGQLESFDFVNNWIILMGFYNVFDYKEEYITTNNKDLLFVKFLEKNNVQPPVMDSSSPSRSSKRKISNTNSSTIEIKEKTRRKRRK